MQIRTGRGYTRGGQLAQEGEFDRRSWAVVTNECQKGAIGDAALWPALAEEARTMVDSLVRVVEAARAEGIAVAHLVTVRRPDHRGANTNAPVFSAATRSGGLVEGTPAVELIDELGPAPADLVINKTHGVASMRTTGLDNALRSLGTGTVVLTGVSLNVAIPALAFEAVNLGYRVVIPLDAVAGVPRSYAEDVLKHTLPLVADVITSDELLSAWRTSD